MSLTTSGPVSEASHTYPTSSSAFSLPNLNSQDVLQRTIRAATEGDPFALARLQTLSNQEKSVFRRTWPVISHYLQTPLPRQRTPAPDMSKEESMVARALVTLFSGAEDKDHPLESLLLSQADNLLRWMPHFYTKWVFNVPSAKLHTIEAASHPFRKQLFGMIPAFLKRMSEHPEIVVIMNKNADAATTLAQMTIVCNRDRHLQLVACTKLIRLNLDAVETHRLPLYMTPFLHFLARHSHTYAEAILGHIRYYGSQEKMSKPTLPELSDILIQLMTCIHHGSQPGGDSLLDACLEQEGFIQTFMFILLTASEEFQPGRPRSWTQREEFLLSITQSTSRILGKSFARGGASVIHAALIKGLLRVWQTLRKLFDNRVFHDRQFCQYLDESLQDMVESTIIYVIYPSVFRETVLFLGAFDADKAHKRPPAQLPGFSRALVRLTARLGEECQTLLGHVDKQVAASHYAKLYKFCDNVECPYKRRRKLGRCIACQSGYYCSEYCQKAVWRNGHRAECKKVAASIRTEGFPPVLTIHDKEYLKRTLASRIRFNITMERIPPVMENTSVSMNLTQFPAVFSASYLRDIAPGDPGFGAVLVVAKVSTGTKLGDGAEITIRLKTSELWNK